MESFETKSFTSNGGLLIENELHCHSLYRSWKSTHYYYGL